MANAKEKEIITVFDIATGQQTTREMTEQEIADRKVLQAQEAETKAAAEAKAAARQSALAKLAELGLTEEEIAAL